MCAGLRFTDEPSGGYAKQPGVNTMREIRDAVAVVTGAGSGIGRALAVDLARRGAKLALADVDAAGLEETRQMLGAVQAKSYTVDVSNAAAMAEFAARVEKDFGGASLLINNAGVALFGTFAEVSLADMDWLIRINFWGVIHGCKFFLPLLERQPEAHIVNVSSVFGLIGPPGQTAYCSAKFAVRGFSECLREELRETRIHVTCVHPAGINTRIAINARAGAGTRPGEKAEALKRFGKMLAIPPEVAARTIVEGVLRNRDRVLIGKDAYRIDFMQRLFPVKVGAMFAKWAQKRAQAESGPEGTEAPQAAGADK
jgi:NAD(P)-dependent dehydrogenase (short-subunit alcohol dehydrogenase family)